MSRSTTASTSKNPSWGPSKSAWARGPPQKSISTTSSHSQSTPASTSLSVPNPADFYATHSQRSNALGLGVSIKDGVKVPRSAVKQGSGVTFGSTNELSAPISSSPSSSASAVQPAGSVKSVGSVTVQNLVSEVAVTNRPPPLSSASSSHSAPPSAFAPSVSKFDKKSSAKLFAGPSTQSKPTPPHEAAPPASQSASLSSHHTHGQPAPFLLPVDPRQVQNGNSSASPRSPLYSRPMANGQSGGIDVISDRALAGSSGSSASPTPTVMPSPRLSPHAPPSSPLSGMPPPPTVWQGYYVRAVSLDLVASNSLTY
ncbi:hypothetical protein EI94DRAFT_815537 [Lactarius quietus]|nr:hypothetical protein EI94DRAFT_815537 [Lactarius quietus]